MSFLSRIVDLFRRPKEAITGLFPAGYWRPIRKSESDFGGQDI